MTKAYGRNAPIIRDFSLEVAAGEFLVLVGPSGSGKSTVLRMIAGLERINSGDLLIDGKRSNDVPPGDREMSMVFQNFALYAPMTNRENIEFPLRCRAPKADIRTEVENTARNLGIAELLDRYPRELSGGEQQRVAMGRAMSRQPSIFLMDEPLSSLDVQLRARLRSEITRISQELGVTTVYVTHDQAEAMSMGDRIAVMCNGSLQQVGSPQYIYNLPSNAFVASFIGAPRISLLQAEIHAPLGGGIWINIGKQHIPLAEPLSLHHQMLRVHQGLQATIGLRADALRIAKLDTLRPNEIVLGGIVENVDYLGRESWIQVEIGARAAIVREPNRANFPEEPARNSMLSRLGSRASEFVGRKNSRSGNFRLASVGQDVSHYSGLTLRAGSDFSFQRGQRVPVIVDLSKMYIFDHGGNRICPASKFVDPDTLRSAKKAR
ncbi:ABC transporter ATP-binding protein [Streptomyces sp. NPDC094468]|uniref:ABC transporter ATP-binding protein n=1 Tax=Streptomyces sp. NPDC094468 TaxID=3366066 RepID=UPI00382B89A8